MKISSSNVEYHELIGLDMTIIDSSDRTLIGLSGRIMNETKNTFGIKTSNGFRIIPKRNVELLISLQNKTEVVLYGKKIAYRPEDRIGKMRRLH
jgi:ribonuclease P protein subunit POP4